MVFDEKIHLELNKVLADKFAVPAVNYINNELTKYRNELANSDLSKDEILLKILFKSNELVLKESVNISTIFAQFSPDFKKQIIEKFKTP